MGFLCVSADAQRLHAGHGRPPDYEARMSLRFSSITSVHKAECHGRRVYLNFIAGLGCFKATPRAVHGFKPTSHGTCMFCCTGICMARFTIKMVVKYDALCAEAV